MARDDLHSEGFSKYMVAVSPSDPNCDYAVQSPHKLTPQTIIGGKRKISFTDTEMEMEDEEEKLSRPDFDLLDDEGRKFGRIERQNHSEIEKRRRDKMNTYITELSSLVPMCCAMNRKHDKLTVLRLAVQHMKTLKGAVDAHTEVSHKPSFLSDEELKHLILQSAGGFLFVVSCDRGRILYVSESVKSVLQFRQPELIGQSLFDFIHPKDVSKVKEQLLSSDMSPRERFIDAKTMMPVKAEVPHKQSQFCSGARRSFFCRMKAGSDPTPPSKTKRDSDIDLNCRRRRTDRKQFSVIHCSGYIKSWSRAKMGIEEDNEADSDGCDLSCLVAVGHLQQPVLPRPVANLSDTSAIRPNEFCARHTLDGKFSYVDQRVTAILGYLPQELLGSSAYEYYHFADIPHLSESHKAALKSREKMETSPYRFKAKSGSFVQMKTRLYSFVNPWTKEMEYLVCSNSVILTQDSSQPGEGESSQYSQEMDNQQGMLPQSNMPSSKISPSQDWAKGSQPGVGKIGRTIMDEILKDCAPSSANPGPSLFKINKNLDAAKNGKKDGLSRASGASNSPFKVPRNVNMHQSFAAGSQGDVNTGNSGLEPDFMSDSTSDATDSDEAAMAIIMSLLEADAGLGGPVDFSDLPWPL